MCYFGSASCGPGSDLVLTLLQSCEVAKFLKETFQHVLVNKLILGNSMDQHCRPSPSGSYIL